MGDGARVDREALRLANLVGEVVSLGGRVGLGINHKLLGSDFISAPYSGYKIELNEERNPAALKNQPLIPVDSNAIL